MQRMAWAAVALIALAGCIAHEKNGDSAAASGEWRGAYYEYAQAAQAEPGSAPLQVKLQKARTEAVTQSLQKARACVQASDWACGLEEANFVRALNGDSADVLALQATAAKGMALSRVLSARDEGSHGNYAQAFTLLGKAAATSNDPQVLEAAQVAKGELLARMDATVEQLRARLGYAQALQLAELAARVDSAHQGLLEQVQREYAVWAQAQYEQRAAAGEAALGEHRWAIASARFREALQFRGGGRAEPLLAYASALELGESALARQDFQTASDGFRNAVASGADRDGYAAAQLQRVEVRPYQIRLRSVLVYAFRPGGLPWAGRGDPSLEPLLRTLARTAIPRDGAGLETAIAQARMLPQEFAPTLQVQAVLPDRGLVVSAPQRGFFQQYDTTFVVMTNAFDTRLLELRVRHVGETPEDAGTFAIPLRDIVGAGRLSVADRAVARLELVAEPTRMAPGTLVGWNVPPPEPPAVAPPAARQPWRMWLTDIAVRLVPGDCGMPSRAASAVEVEQSGRSLFRSPTLRSLESQWRPEDVSLSSAERIRVKVWELASGRPVLVMDTWVFPDRLATGGYEAVTPRGSWLSLRFSAPVRVGSVP